MRLQITTEVRHGLRQLYLEDPDEIDEIKRLMDGIAVPFIGKGAVVETRKSIVAFHCETTRFVIVYIGYKEFMDEATRLRLTSIMPALTPLLRVVDQ